jgi:dTDP-4-amino-4,6-dideoxygalactose transaminase
MKYIPYGKQSISNEDKKLVLRSLNSPLITTGYYVNELEKKIKKYLKSKYTLVCSSGTAGLHLALLSINIKKTDNVIMPAINFIASYNMASTFGANIYLCDVDPYNGQMTPELLSKCIKKNKLKKIKAVITMYLGGYPLNIINFYKLKKKYNFFIIEDSCHALGAEYTYLKKSYKIGSCNHSDLAVFSFHPLKSITTGEGGAICTNNSKLYKKILLLRSHGIKRSKKHWIYDVQMNGYNYRLSDINCALGISQLKRLDDFIRKRENIYNYYKKKIQSLKRYLKIIDCKKFLRPSYHLLPINIDFKNLKISKDELIEQFYKKRIITQQHYIPIFKFKKIFKEKIKISDFKGSNDYYNNTISLPIYYNLSKKQISYIINILKNILSKYEN